MLNKNLTLSYGLDSITIKRPSYPYSVIIRNGLRYITNKKGRLRSFDFETSYRILEIPVWYLKPEQQDLLEDFIDTARGNPIVMTLPTNSGLYPFGPDFCDSGEFSFVIEKYSPTGMLYSPYKCFKNKIRLIAQSLPASSVLPKKSQGNLRIGTVDGLKTPQLEINYEKTSTQIARVKNSGAVDTVYNDVTNHISTVKIDLNTANASRLCNELNTVIRGNQFEVELSQGYNLFGRGVVDASGIYPVSANLSEVEFINTGYNRWETELTLHYNG